MLAPASAADNASAKAALAIVQAIAKAHRGEVTAVSPGPNQGSTFILTLPASA